MRGEGKVFRYRRRTLYDSAGHTVGGLEASVRHRFLEQRWGGRFFRLLDSWGGGEFDLRGFNT